MMTENGLDTSFQLDGGRRCVLSLTDTDLEWEVNTKDPHDPDIKDNVLIGWILNIRQSSQAPTKEQSLPCTLTISYIINDVRHADGAHLKVAELVLCGAAEQCEKWVKEIKSRIKSAAPNRPKNALVFLNPVSGSGKSKKVYEDRIAPVFALAEVNIDLHVIKEPGQSTKIIDAYNLEKIDSIMILGGDGTVSSLMSALIGRLVREDGQDINNPDVKLSAPKINVGVIPTGTSNVVPLACHCSIDPLTSTLCILMGSTRRKDVYTIHSDSTFMCLTIATAGYALYAKLMKLMEKLRWMGITRYKVAPALVLLGRPLIDVEIDILSDATCRDVSNANQESKPEWCRHTGPIMDFCFTLLDFHDVIIKYPFNDIFQGDHNKLPDLRVTTWCSLGDHVKAAKALFKPKECIEPEYPYLSVYKNVREVRFRAAGKSIGTDEGLWSVMDGEFNQLPAPEMDIRVQPNLIPMFVRTDVEELCLRDKERLAQALQ